MVASRSPVSKYLKTVVTFSISLAVRLSPSWSTLVRDQTRDILTSRLFSPESRDSGGLVSVEFWGVSLGLTLLLDSGFMAPEMTIIKLNPKKLIKLSSIL